jgi:hypothetical protein
MSITLKGGETHLINPTKEVTLCLIANIWRDRIIKDPASFELIINDVDISEYVIQLIDLHSKNVLSDESLIASLSLLFHS